MINYLDIFRLSIDYISWDFQDPKLQVRQCHISGHIFWGYSLKFRLEQYNISSNPLFLDTNDAYPDRIFNSTMDSHPYFVTKARLEFAGGIPEVVIRCYMDIHGHSMEMC